MHNNNQIHQRVKATSRDMVHVQLDQTRCELTGRKISLNCFHWEIYSFHYWLVFTVVPVKNNKY